MARHAHEVAQAAAALARRAAFPLAAQSLTLLIKDLQGRTRVVHVPAGASVEEAKGAIQRAGGAPVQQQRLIWRGKQLEDYKTLAEYDVPNEAVIHLVLRLRGGMMHETVRGCVCLVRVRNEPLPVTPAVGA